MSLIDTDKLKTYLSKYLHYNHAVPWVDAQPTAYDVDKVLKQLEELTEEECTLHECGIRSERCKPCIAKKAIEIVKAGGIDDD